MIRKFLAFALIFAIVSCGGGKHDPIVNEKDSVTNPANYGKDGAPDTVYGISDTTKTRADSGAANQ
jgi:hypothetical protein